MTSTSTENVEVRMRNTVLSKTSTLFELEGGAAGDGTAVFVSLPHPAPVGTLLALGHDGASGSGYS